jgi:hypothetical protein
LSDTPDSFKSLRYAVRALRREFLQFRFLWRCNVRVISRPEFSMLLFTIPFGTEARLEPESATHMAGEARNTELPTSVSIRGLFRGARTHGEHWRQTA